MKQGDYLTLKEAEEAGYWFPVTDWGDIRERIKTRSGKGITQMRYDNWCVRFVKGWRERNRDPENDAVVVLNGSQCCVAAKKTMFSASKIPFLSTRLQKLWEEKIKTVSFAHDDIEKRRERLNKKIKELVEQEVAA